MNNQVILKNKINVFSKSKYKTINKQANIFFSKIPKEMPQKEFEEMVKDVGDVFSIKFLEHENEDFNQAYVQYEKIDYAKNAVSLLNDKEVYGKKLAVSTTSKNNIIFLRGPESTTVMSEIKEVLQPFGEVFISEKTLSSDGKEYILSIRFTSEQKSR